MKNEYKSICNKCYKRTWYETVQPCHVAGCTGTLQLIDNTNISTHLNIGSRYSFQDSTGKIKRFTLGKTTGWRPCLLLLHNSRSLGSSRTVNAPDLVYTVQNWKEVYKINNYYFD